MHTRIKPVTCIQDAVRILLLLTLSGMAVSASDVAAQTDSTRFTELFPAAMDGWTVDPVEMTELDGLTTGFETYIPSGVPPSVRLRLSRVYQVDNRRIEMGLDTEDIRMAALIDSAHEEEDVREELSESGFTTRMFGAYHGLVIRKDAEAGLLIRLGMAGVFYMGGAYSGCEQDLELYLASLNLDAMARFVDSDHRRSRQKE